MSHARIALSLTLALLTGPALAQEWGHAAAPMGQYEGGISMGDGAYAISYGCAGFYGTVSLHATGVHVAAGQSVLRVDGVEVARGNTVYNSESDATVYEFRAEREWDPKLWEPYNRVVNALASGTEAVWEAPSGETFSFPLTGSAEIRSCLMN